MKKTLGEQTARMKAIKQLYDSSAAFRSLKPVYDGLQKIKFEKPRAKYKAEHEAKLKQFYAARRLSLIHIYKNKTFKDVYGWGSSTICNILEKREYLGHTINFKTRKHFKDKKSHYVPEDEWTIFENTHEAIIDQQTFDLVQKIRGNVRRYPDGWGEAAPLTGLLYCADCGGKMYVHRTNNGKRISQYTLSLIHI